MVGGLAQQSITSGDYNIYDPFAGNPAALGMTTTTSRDMFSKIKEFYASAAFDMFEMGGGTSAMVVGAEYREEQFQNQYDLLSAAGQVAGSSGASSAGERDVTAVYAEMLFPIADSFEINLAARHDRYSDYGSDTSPKISMRWQPLDTLTIRGSYGEGFRAPALDILSAAASFSASFITHPATCLSQGLAANCSTQINEWRIANPNLESENSEQFGLGVVWDATDWMNVSLDYYDIEITNQIAFIGTESIGEAPGATPTEPGTNRLNMPPRTPPLDEEALERITAEIAHTVETHDVTIVMPHWGTQYTYEPEEIQRQIAQRWADVGVDLILGGHPHWVQGWDALGDTTVVYSLPNFVFDMEFSRQVQEGVLVEIVLWGEKVVAVEPVPYVIRDHIPQPADEATAASAPVLRTFSK